MTQKSILASICPFPGMFRHMRVPSQCIHFIIDNFMVRGASVSLQVASRWTRATRASQYMWSRRKGSP